jgi:glycosyltransferase involved in cell wall biosynthesis
MEKMTKIYDIADKSTIRVLFDLQACQTEGSAHRGVGRYSWSLYNGISQYSKKWDVRGAASNQLKHSLPHPKIPDQTQIILLNELSSWQEHRQFEQGTQDQLDSYILSLNLAQWKPDIIHVSHVFEGYSERVPLPLPKSHSCGQITTATLYDLIPLIFQDHYFKDDRFRMWYYSRISWLQQVDLLLAISESSRQDAINFLNIDPSRIVTINGGVADHFSLAPVGKSHADFKKQFNIQDRFVLYTGGDDHRKNISGAIRGFALIPKHVRQRTQLVIVCAMEASRQVMYFEVAKSAGLSQNDVVITGWVSEEDLVQFYQSCDVFVFPSLYEGLGLPVLEAMACGAPVIGGDNSSIREIIADADALFDASSDEAIAQSITRVLVNDAFAAVLRAKGPVRAKQYNWQNTSILASGGMAEALAKRRHQGYLAAFSGWEPKKKLALLSPLPPCKSGIADYNAKFIPHLSRHFDIDLFVDGYLVTDEKLLATCTIRRVSEFEPIADQYDAILYEFGNSEFHVHMLELLKKYPGIVGLHDAYLSGMMGYIDFNLGQTGSYSDAMLDAHGTLARRYFAPIVQHPDANGASMIELPCTKQVLDSALGIISHSPYNLEIARKFYPQGWLAPYRTIPQSVPFRSKISKLEQSTLKLSLDFPEDATILATFGHVAWTKCGDRLVSAYLSSMLRHNPKAFLVFVGELSDDQFGRTLRNAIESAKVGSHVRITGYVDEQTYAAYLHVSDVAIQLRTKSRGGTPRGVLDCLAAGCAVIVNDDASYRDYPDNVVSKLSADPSEPEIVSRIEELIGNVGAREKLATAGRQYVVEIHAPERCAAEYAAAINDFRARAREATITNTIKSLAPLLARSNTENVLALAASEIEGMRQPHFKRRKIMIDVSHIAANDHGTGIPRVVRNIVSELYRSSTSGFEPIAVVLVDGQLQVACDWLNQHGLLTSGEKFTRADVETDTSAGDIFLMLDSSWARYSEFIPVFNRIKSKGVSVCTAVYDLLPIQLPPGNIVDGGKEWFKGWLNLAIEQSDALVCISRSVADDLVAYQDVNIAPPMCKPVGYWHLGSDFSVRTSASFDAIKPEVKHALTQPYLLMVGTIEPRKQHQFAITTFEELWSRGEKINIVIAGKEGWMVSEFMDELRQHPRRDKQLFLFESPSDIEIMYMYEKATALLFLSKGEGFGLPLVEAAAHNIPILCSDLAVFREIAGKHATYVSTVQAKETANQIGAWLHKLRSGTDFSTKNMQRLTWEQSAEMLVTTIVDKKWIN